MPISIGEHTYGNPILRGNHNTVTIGKYCSIAEGVILDCGFSHNHKFVTTYPFNPNWGFQELPLNLKIKGDITIGNDVWIGEGSVIMSGVNISDGAVIGMNTIVTKHVCAYEVVVGHHRVVDYRFTSNQIEKLRAIAWWNWPDEKVRENVPLLLSENIDEFINKHYDHS